MIQKETSLKPIDNCGVWAVKVFQLYGGSFRRVSYIGNFVKISVKRTRPNNWIPKKTKLKSILVLVKKELNKIDGSYIKVKSNNTVLLKKRLGPKGKVLLGPTSTNIRRKKFMTSFSGIL